MQYIPEQSEKVTQPSAVVDVIYRVIKHTYGHKIVNT